MKLPRRTFLHLAASAAALPAASRIVRAQTYGSRAAVYAALQPGIKVVPQYDQGARRLGAGSSIMPDTSASIATPKHWRERAEEARAMAAQISDQKAKSMMLHIGQASREAGGRAAVLIKLGHYRH
jgi:hypothetical protein